VEEEQKNPRSTLLRNFVIEMVAYGILLAAYFSLVLRFLNEPLKRMFEGNLPLYTFISLLLIVIQAVLLDWVVKFIIQLFGLNRV
jgi:hypothetical protein